MFRDFMIVDISEEQMPAFTAECVQTYTDMLTAKGYTIDEGAGATVELVEIEGFEYLRVTVEATKE